MEAVELRGIGRAAVQLSAINASVADLVLTVVVGEEVGRGVVLVRAPLLEENAIPSAVRLVTGASTAKVSNTADGVARTLLAGIEVRGASASVSDKRVVGDLLNSLNRSYAAGSCQLVQ